MHRIGSTDLDESPLGFRPLCFFQKGFGFVGSAGEKQAGTGLNYDLIMIKSLTDNL